MNYREDSILEILKAKDIAFNLICAERNIKPTRRQYSKWRMNKGIARNIYNRIRAIKAREELKKGKSIPAYK